MAGPVRMDESEVLLGGWPVSDDLMRSARLDDSHSAVTYTLFNLTADSFVGAFLFRGAGCSSKVQFCLWKSHKTHVVLSELKTHRLFRRRQASQGRSGLLTEFGVSPMRELVGEVDIDAVSSSGTVLCIVSISADDHLESVT